MDYKMAVVNAFILIDKESGGTNFNISYTSAYLQKLC